MKDELFAYIREELGVEADYPFKDDIAIFRHTRNKKWFAAMIMGISRRKLGFEDDEVCDIVDLKCDPMIAGSYRKLPGILKGYHMNKEHWITVLLDGTVESKTLWELVNISYDLTAAVVKRKKGVD